MSGNVLSRDRSLSEDVHRPKLFKLRFASYILFTHASSPHLSLTCLCYLHVHEREGRKRCRSEAGRRRKMGEGA